MARPLVDSQCLAFQTAIDVLGRPWTALILPLRLQSPSFDIREMECSPSETALYNKLFANPAAGIDVK